MADKKAEALKIVEEGLKELESTKGSVTVGVQKLSRAAKLLDNEEVWTWCQVQLGNTKYTNALGKLCKKLSTEYEKENKTQNIFDKKYKEEIENINKLKIPLFDINE
ncbi:helix-hairpin-helix domain-containing protein, partial [bacterium LRH843]|nr:helix-hairpin-helix domain-containing protein [bacterium LRH843]